MQSKNSKKAEKKVSKATAASMVTRILKNARAAPMLKATSDEKGRMTLERPVGGSRDMLHASLGKNPFRTKLFTLASGATGSSGVAVAAVVQANMATASEWSTFAALFDEVRARNVKLTLWTALGTQTTGAETLGIVVFDIDDGTALGSVAAGLPYARRAGPHGGAANLSTRVAVPNYALTHEGYQLSTGKLEPGFPDESAGTPVAYPVRGSWVATSSSTAIVGFFKTYIEAVASNTWFYRSMLEYDVEFRMRS